MKMADPNDREAIEKLQFILNRPIVAVPGSREEVIESIDKDYGAIDGVSSENILMEFTDTAIDFSESSADQHYGEDKIDEHSAPVVRMVNLMLAEPINLGYQGATIVVRLLSDRCEIIYLIDGQSNRRDSPPARLASAIRSRLLIMSKLDIGNRTGLQLGSLKITVGSQDVDYQMFVIPTAVGWTIALVDLSSPRVKCADDMTLQLVDELLREAAAVAGDDAGLADIVDKLRGGLPMWSAVRTC